MMNEDPITPTTEEGSEFSEPRAHRREKILLYEELRFVERNESEINSTWKSAHLLLFFLAFVFGSFCTFCFHMLMYMFDEKCVLFPKLLSLSAQRHSKIFEYLPLEQELANTLPVDFLSTQWVEKNVCYLPTFVPLVSGIFGLVWITMLLMCNAGSRTQTGLQSPWRILLPVFIFSVAMGALCVYASVLTQAGLAEFCNKLAEATNSQTCSYAINVVTLLYERRISGVYQATRLTVLSAWTHTACWLLSAALVLARVALAVDFQLVRVQAVLDGDLDVMLQRNEKQIRSVYPELAIGKEKRDKGVQKDGAALGYPQGPGVAYYPGTVFPADAVTPPGTVPHEHVTIKLPDDASGKETIDLEKVQIDDEVYYIVPLPKTQSVNESADYDDWVDSSREAALKKQPKQHRFIVRFLYDFVDDLIEFELEKSAENVTEDINLLTPPKKSFAK
ncbi:unnamed protein product [Plutella xylostella]|uniref:(diamondback moth) hypothetical protein n=1 Tax=Plutella xylostella TaxID=51655 RepID=A0A8S4G1N6_PLUXY|nr:unnamed protein product [Plutella xylostella]